MRILVGYDGSKAARRALAHAAELVGSGGSLDVINVISAQPVSARIESLSDRERSRQRKLLREARLVLGEWEVGMTPVQAVGIQRRPIEPPPRRVESGSSSSAGAAGCGA